MPGSEADLTINAIRFAMDPISMGGEPMSIDVGSMKNTKPQRSEGAHVMAGRVINAKRTRNASQHSASAFMSETKGLWK